MSVWKSLRKQAMCLRWRAFFFIKMESFLVLRKYASNIGKACFILLTLDLYDRIHVIMGLYHINNKLIIILVKTCPHEIEIHMVFTTPKLYNP